MSITSIGDLAQSLQFRRQNADLRMSLTRLTTELATGQRSNLATYLGGELSPLVGIERGLTRIAGFSTAASDLVLETDARQAAVDVIRMTADDVAGALILVDETSSNTQIGAVGRDAETRMESVIQQLNLDIGDRSLFAGLATDGTALADAATILDAIEAELTLAAVETVDDIVTVVDAFFGPGGGFETVGYLGGAPMTQSINVSASETVAPPPTASDQPFRDVLSALSLASLAGRGALSNNPEGPGSLARFAGERLLNSDNGLVDIQADLGRAQAQIERAQIGNASETAALDLAKTDLIGVDPFETAVDLQGVEQSLIQLFTITGRLADLSLTRYLR